MNAFKKELEEVCAKYCAYYKPGSKEADACMGLEALHKLIESGIDIKMPEDTGGLIPSGIDAEIDRAVCSECSWRASDCDYRDPAGPAGARPCGGVVLIALLLAGGQLNGSDLDR